MSPTARALQHARKFGYVGGVVERWNPGARVRQDFLGFADLLFVVPGEFGVLAVQACTTGDQSKRWAKIMSEGVRDRAAAWCASGNRIAIWGWAKRGPRGKRKTWTLSESWVTTAALAGAGAHPVLPPPPGAEALE